MTAREGFLVVSKSPQEVTRSHNRRYKGLFRVPLWSRKEYERGFDDPLVFGDYTNDAGLIRNWALVQEVLTRFAEVEPSDSLEIIFVRATDGSVSEGPPVAGGYQFLGFDVAGTAPFWSIVLDSPDPSDPDLRRLLGYLNEHGLFEQALDTYRTQILQDQDIPLHIWEVHLVR